MSTLAVRHLSKAFGGVRAVRDVSFAVEPGELLAMIGPNGAGKSTCFNLVNGQLKPDAGETLLLIDWLEKVSWNERPPTAGERIPEAAQMQPLEAMDESLSKKEQMDGGSYPADPAEEKSTDGLDRPYNDPQLR